MPRDIIAERLNRQPRDLLAERGIQPETMGWRGVAEDIPGAIGSALGGIAGQYMNLPGNIAGTVSQGFTDSHRQNKNIFAGLGEGAHELLSIPRAAQDYGVRKGVISQDFLNLFPNKGRGLLPESTEYISKLLGIKGEDPRDQEVRDLTKFAMFGGVPLTKGLSKLSGSVPGVKYLKSGTKKSIADMIVADKQAEQAWAKGAYENLFNEAKNKGVEKIGVPKSNTATIIKYSPKYSKTLQEYLEDPTMQTGHWAQSDLGKLVNSLKKKDTLTAHEGKMLRDAQSLRNHIQKEMFQAEEVQHLKKPYEQLGQQYKERVPPYTNKKAIREYEQGMINEEDMIKSLQGNKYFRQDLQPKYKKYLDLNKRANKYGEIAKKTLKYSLLGAAGIPYAGSLYNKISDLLTATD